MKELEGDYLWKKWCKKHKYPDTYEKLKKLLPHKSEKELDDLWEKINNQYIEETK